ncbi:MAG: hypothetical protein U5J98_02120 [Halobacteriales archaeon]|nr:hypothetical protein [Halobacteriales archaeon]
MTVAAVVTAVVGSGIAGVGLLFALSGVQHYLQGRRISGWDITRIAEVEAGPVAVSATARPADDGTLRAPFSARDCLAYQYEVREAQGKNRETPTLIAEGAERVPFTVEDESGSVVVRPDGSRPGGAEPGRSAPEF